MYNIPPPHHKILHSDIVRTQFASTVSDLVLSIVLLSMLYDPVAELKDVSHRLVTFVRQITHLEQGLP